ncbi:MAG: esterase-like activity of phytase family protein [Candidatus Andeanibacterium colombiense]|uniref:Esterase-like activity of phytase family protein n=1 Tax=Candidatus Andeanibacterium colombiense TaxID=3121345 RepID=A0AAJ5X4J2_9SPHN|nr:MAG: esterase-like activity of phytase family protein [Sphingomonadaceae bacterium]
MRRLLLLLLVVAGLSPGLLWRDGLPKEVYTQSIELLPLALPGAADRRIGGSGGPLLTGAWQLKSPNFDFGSYSALVVPKPGILLSISDRGKYLRFGMPGSAAAGVEIGTVLPGSDSYKPLQDMESATRDPASGRIWIGLEFSQAFLRLDPDFSRHRMIAPPEMRHWRANGGPEAMTRLRDGRFVVIAEQAIHWSDTSREALVFARDPLDGGRPAKFRFTPPPGYDPSDMTQLPDGRVLILLRGLKFFPPGFAVRLVMADPADIKPGGDWPWRDVGELSSPIPMDNYEGLAATGGENGGPLTLWLISDDNQSKIIQRSLLLRFEWKPPALR